MHSALSHRDRLASAVVAVAAVVLALVRGVIAQDAMRLVPGAPIERALEGKIEHAYRLPLNGGDYAHLTLDQQGVDVIIRLVDRNGATIADLDAESRAVGRERIDLVADEAGEYRVIVRPRYPKIARGRYTLTLDEVRPATARDRAVQEALRRYFEFSNLWAAAKYAEAADAATRALSAAEAAWGPDDPQVGSVLTAISRVHGMRGDARGGIQLLQRAVAIFEATVGRNDPRTALALDLIGLNYNSLDDPVNAEPAVREALAITEQTLGAMHPRTAIELIDLGSVQSKRQDDVGETRSLLRALAIAEQSIEPEEVMFMALLSDLGNLYVAQQEFDRAEPYLLRSLALLEKTQGPEHPRVAYPLLQLSIIARQRKQFDRALEYVSRAYAVREKALGPNNPQAAQLLITVGNVHLATGNYDKALALYQQARDVLEPALGPYHSLTLLTILNAARAYAAKDDVAHAIEYQRLTDRIIERIIDLNLAVGSDREKLAYLESTFERTSRTISLSVGQASNRPEAADLAAQALLQRKGRVQDAMSASLATLRGRLNEGDRQALDRLAAARTQLARLSLNGPGRTPRAEYQQRLAQASEEQNRLEADVSARSAAFRAQSQPVSLDAVRTAIPPEAALVELAVYEPFVPKAANDQDAHGAPHYVAYVIRRDGPVRFADLGPSAAIDGAAASLRKALRDPARDDVRRLARQVDHLVMQPLRELTGDASRLLISPDGELNLLPFEALVDEQNRYLVQRFAISYLTTGRDLLRLQVARPSRSQPIVFANPLFGERPSSDGAAATAPQPTARHAASRSVTSAENLASVYFAPLAGTGYEARAIQSLFPDARVVSGRDATKHALEQLEAPGILHIATHGFFLSGATSIENPLLRSGLALSGANLKAATNSDGLLTALEASGLDLWGTRLVTLSACDTGVGDVKSGEGVYGLRRAFFLAGAETVVMSLWPVSDAVTRELMTQYYRGLKQGLGRGDALRRAELATLARAGRQHPFYWASFIQAGEWANLDGQRQPLK